MKTSGLRTCSSSHVIFTDLDSLQWSATSVDSCCLLKNKYRWWWRYILGWSFLRKKRNCIWCKKKVTWTSWSNLALLSVKEGVLFFLYIPSCWLRTNYILNNTFTIKHGLSLPYINLLQMTCTQCFRPVLPKGRSAWNCSCCWSAPPCRWVVQSAGCCWQAEENTRLYSSVTTGNSVTSCSS